MGQLQDPNKFVAWGAAVVRNTTINYYNRTKPMIAKEEDATENISIQSYSPEHQAIVKDMNPEHMLDKQETSRLIKDMLEQLSDDQRLCIYLFYMQEKSVKEIAEEMKVSENTVKSRLNYGRKNIEKQVLLLEKKGTKLYNLAPFTFFLWLYRVFLSQQETAVNVSSEMERAMMEQSVKKIIEKTVDQTDKSSGSFINQVKQNFFKEKHITEGIRKIQFPVKEPTQLAAYLVGKPAIIGIAVICTVIGGTVTSVTLSDKKIEKRYHEAAKLIFDEYQAVCNDEDMRNWWEDWQEKYPNVDSNFLPTDAYYYAYYDINHDGIPELIADSDENEIEGNWISVIYGFDGDKWIKMYNVVVSGGIKICVDGTILESAGNGGIASPFRISRIQKKGTSIEIQELDTMPDTYTEVDLSKLDWKKMF